MMDFAKNLMRAWELDIEDNRPKHEVEKHARPGTRNARMSTILNQDLSQNQGLLGTTVVYLIQVKIKRSGVTPPMPKNHGNIVIP